MRQIKFRGIAVHNNDGEEETGVKKGEMVFGQLIFDRDQPYIVGPAVEVTSEYVAPLVNCGCVRTVQLENWSGERTLISPGDFK